MNQCLSFDDTLITPKFSTVESRKDVDLTTSFLGMQLSLPIISSNMDSVTESNMASAMVKCGAVGALHRFMTIDKNVEEFYKSNDLIFNSDSKHKNKPIVSIGVGEEEYKRAMALAEAGATHFLLDLAHGASIQAVRQYDKLRARLTDNCYIIVGNFATGASIKEFNNNIKSNKLPDAYKVGIGGGSICSTRIVTGCGIPTLSSLLDCKDLKVPIIADGGIRNSGDIAKALAAGASVIMCGNLLAGTDETPGKVIWDREGEYELDTGYKEYRGSASYESYKVQGKLANHRSPEGESTLVRYKGPVQEVLQNLEGGLRSAFSYVGAFNMEQFKNNAKLIYITNNSYKESLPYGKTQ